MNIFLIGVYHDFQYKIHAEFLDYLRDTCHSLKIKSIGEEMNVDALRLAKVNNSTVLKIAEELGLLHAYCDPDDKEREIKGILGQNDIKFNQFFNDLSEEEASALKSKHFEKREKVWLEKIQEVFVEPMLFVCGIQHLESFCSLLRENGYNCHVMGRKWSAGKI